MIIIGHPQHSRRPRAECGDPGRADEQLRGDGRGDDDNDDDNDNGDDDDDR